MRFNEIENLIENDANTGWINPGGTYKIKCEFCGVYSLEKDIKNAGSNVKCFT